MTSACPISVVLRGVADVADVSYAFDEGFRQARTVTDFTVTDDNILRFVLYLTPAEAKSGTLHVQYTDKISEKKMVTRSKLHTAPAACTAQHADVASDLVRPTPFATKDEASAMVQRALASLRVDALVPAPLTGQSTQASKDGTTAASQTFVMDRVRAATTAIHASVEKQFLRGASGYRLGEALDMRGKRLGALPAPQDPADAATKGYVDVALSRPPVIGADLRCGGHAVRGMKSVDDDDSAAATVEVAKRVAAAAGEEAARGQVAMQRQHAVEVAALRAAIAEARSDAGGQLLRRVKTPSATDGADCAATKAYVDATTGGVGLDTCMAPIGDVSLNGQHLTDLPASTAPDHAVNRAELDVALKNMRFSKLRPPVSSVRMNQQRLVGVGRALERDDATTLADVEDRLREATQRTRSDAQQQLDAGIRGVTAQIERVSASVDAVQQGVEDAEAQVLDAKARIASCEGLGVKLEQDAAEERQAVSDLRAMVAANHAEWKVETAAVAERVSAAATAQVQGLKGAVDTTASAAAARVAAMEGAVEQLRRDVEGAGRALQDAAAERAAHVVAVRDHVTRVADAAAAGTSTAAKAALRDARKACEEHVAEQVAEVRKASARAAGEAREAARATALTTAEHGVQLLDVGGRLRDVDGRVKALEAPKPAADVDARGKRVVGVAMGARPASTDAATVGHVATAIEASACEERGAVARAAAARAAVVDEALSAMQARTSLPVVRCAGDVASAMARGVGWAMAIVGDAAPVCVPLRDADGASPLRPLPQQSSSPRALRWYTGDVAHVEVVVEWPSGCVCGRVVPPSGPDGSFERPWPLARPWPEVSAPSVIWVETSSGMRCQVRLLGSGAGETPWAADWTTAPYRRLAPECRPHAHETRVGDSNVVYGEARDTALVEDMDDLAGDNGRTSRVAHLRDIDGRTVKAAVHLGLRAGSGLLAAGATPYAPLPSVEAGEAMLRERGVATAALWVRRNGGINVGGGACREVECVGIRDGSTSALHLTEASLPSLPLSEAVRAWQAAPLRYAKVHGRVGGPFPAVVAAHPGLSPWTPVDTEEALYAGVKAHAVDLDTRPVTAWFRASGARAVLRTVQLVRSGSATLPWRRAGDPERLRDYLLARGRSSSAQTYFLEAATSEGGEPCSVAIPYAVPLRPDVTLYSPWQAVDDGGGACVWVDAGGDPEWTVSGGGGSVRCAQAVAYHPADRSLSLLRGGRANDVQVDMVSIDEAQRMSFRLRGRTTGDYLLTCVEVVGCGGGAPWDAARCQLASDAHCHRVLTFDASQPQRLVVLVADGSSPTLPLPQRRVAQQRVSLAPPPATARVVTRSSMELEATQRGIAFLPLLPSVLPEAALRDVVREALESGGDLSDLPDGLPADAPEHAPVAVLREVYARLALHTADDALERLLRAA